MIAGSSIASRPTCSLSKATATSNGSRATTRTMKPTRSGVSASPPTSHIGSSTSGLRELDGAIAAGRRHLIHARLVLGLVVPRQLFQVRDQKRDAAIVLPEERAELIALLQGQPD